MNWRHLIGLEAVTIFLQTSSVLKNLQESSCIPEALETVSRNSILLLLLDHRCFMLSAKDEQIHNLETMALQQGGPHIGGTIFKALTRKQRSTSKSWTVFEMNRVVKVI